MDTLLVLSRWAGFKNWRRELHIMSGLFRKIWRRPSACPHLRGKVHILNLFSCWVTERLLIYQISGFRIQGGLIEAQVGWHTKLVKLRDSRSTATMEGYETFQKPFWRFRIWSPRILSRILTVAPSGNPAKEVWGRSMVSSREARTLRYLECYLAQFWSLSVEYDQLVGHWHIHLYVYS